MEGSNSTKEEDALKTNPMAKRAEGEGQTKKNSPSLSSIPPAPIFSPGRSSQLPRLRPDLGSIHILPLVALILLLSGQCPNPGPVAHPCGVCGISTTGNTQTRITYLCTGCQMWIHSRCSGLSSQSQFNEFTYRCPACSAGQTAAPNAGNPSPPPSVIPDPSSTAANPANPQPQIRGHFLQFNTNGIKNSYSELIQLINDQNILIACIQETKLTASSDITQLKFPNHAVIRKDRPSGRPGGGLITLVAHSIKYIELNQSSLFPGDNIAEHQAISVEVDGAQLLVCNVYIPPIASCPPGYHPNFNSLFNATGDTLIMGDFNAHDALWYSSTADEAAANRGTSIVEALENSELMVINQDSPTRMPTNGPTSSPDLTITNSHLGLNASWVPKITLNSDHLPIIIDLDGWFAEPPQAGPSCYTNFRKANWELFTTETEQSFTNLPPPSSCDSGEKIFRQVLLKASRRNIPRGKIPNFTPGLSQHSRELTVERDAIRAADPMDQRISSLNARIEEEIQRRRREVWHETMESCSIKRCSSKYYKVLADLSGKRSLQDPNQPVTFNGRSYNDPRKIAIKFAKQFTRPVPHAQDASSRRLLRQIHRKYPLDHQAAPFTPSNVFKAIKSCKNSTAPSADGLTVLQLKHLGPRGIQYLTDLYNLSYRHANLPAIWKHAIILPLLKPGKLKDQGSSYRPISLLCPASKVLEKLISQLLSHHLPLADTQHGFRSSRSNYHSSPPTDSASGFWLQPTMSPPENSGNGGGFLESV